MRPTFSFDKYISDKSPLTHFLLSFMLDSQFKNWTLEFSLKIIAEIQIIALQLSFFFDIHTNKEKEALSLFIERVAHVASFEQIFQFETYSRLTSISFVLVIIYTVFMLILVILLLKAYWQNKTDNCFILLVSANFCLIHYTFCFLFIYQFLLALIFSASQTDIHLLDWTGSSSFVIIGIFLLVPNILLACFASRFCYHPFKNEYKGGMRRGTSNFFGLTFKIFHPFCNVIFTNRRAIILSKVIVTFVLLSIRFWHFISTFPYFNYQPMKTFLRFYFAEVALMLSVIVTIILVLTEDVAVSIGVYMSFILILFFMRISDRFLERMIYYSSFKSVEIKRDFYKKLFAFDYILENGPSNIKLENNRTNSKAEFLYYGLVKNHRNHCFNQDCYCKYILRDHLTFIATTGFQERMNINMQKFRFEFLTAFIQSAIKSISISSEIKLTLAKFLFINRSYSYASAITLIHGSNLTDKNIESKVIRTLFLQKIEKNLFPGTNSTIDTKLLVDYHKFSGELRTKIGANVSKFISFWDLFNLSKPSLKKLCDISIEVNKEAKTIETIWDIISTRYRNLSYQDYLLYGLYQSIVRSAPSTGEKVLQKYLNLYDSFVTKQSKDIPVSMDNLHEDKNIVLYISLSKENLGKIVFNTPNIESLLGYVPLDLIDKNVQILMPNFFQDKHQLILNAHIEKGTSNISNKNCQVFAKKKNGYLSPISLYVSIFPYFRSHLLSVGIIRPIQTYEDFILVLPNGAIDSFSENVGKTLNLDPFSKKRYGLKHICPPLERLNRAFNFMLNGQSQRLKQFRFGLKKSTRKPSISNMVVLKKRNSEFQTVKDVVDAVIKYKIPTKQKITLNEKAVSSKHEDEIKSIGRSKEISNNEEESEVSEDEDWKTLYEQFTSTGVPMHFKQYQKRSEQKISQELIEYNTIISEETIYNSPIRILRLQSLMIESESDDEQKYELDVMAKVTTSEILSSKSIKKSTHRPSAFLTEDDIHIEEYSEENGAIPLEVGLTWHDEGIINFKNPFPEEVKQPKSPQKKSLRIILPEESRKIMFEDLEDDHNLSSIQKGRESNSLKVLQKTNKMVRKSVVIANTFKLTKKHSIKTIDDKNNPNVIPDLKHGLELLFQTNKIQKMTRNEVDGNSVSSVAMVSQLNSKLEAAIHSNEYDFVIKLLNIFVFLFAFSGIAMMAFYIVATNSNLNRLKDNVSVLRSSYSRLFVTLEINRMVRILDILETGLAPIARHTSDYTITSLENLNMLSQNLSLYNSNVRTTIYKVDSALRDRFYEPISVIDVINENRIRVMNTFDASEEIINAGFRLYNFLPDKPKDNDPNIFFILNNTLNDLIIKSEEFTYILTDDNDIQLNSIQITALVLISIVTAVALIVFGIIIRKEMLFMSRKVHFLDVLFRTDEKQIEEMFSLVRSFYVSLIESYKLDKFFERLTNYEFKNTSKKVDGKKGGKSFKTKNGNPKGMNNQIYINIMLTLIFLLMLSLGFWAILIALLSYHDNIDDSMTRVLGTNSNLVKMGLVFTSLYEYISEDGSTLIKNKPIHLEWEANYRDLTKLNDYFNNFDDQSSTFDEKIRNILSGDICNQFFQSKACYTEIEGAVSKGLISINSFMLKTFKEVKDYYDSSKKRQEDKTIALTLKNILEAETAYEKYVKFSYLKMDELLVERFFSKVDEFFYWLINIMVATGIIYAIILKCLWLRLIHRMQQQRNNFRGMLKLIPFNMIMSNKALKNYLVRTSNKILGPLKHRI